MKKNLLIINGATGGLLLLSTMLAGANTVTLTQNPAYSYSDGGAFNAATTQNFAQYYAPVATAGGGFQTFCIESQVTFNPNTTYYYTLSSDDSRGTALTVGAAFLYYEFATGTLPGYFTGNLSTEAGLFQSAIWELQGQTIANNFPNYATDPFYTLAVNEFKSDAGGATAANDGTYNVEVMQLWKTSNFTPGTDAQNQLVYLGPTVPDTAETGLLLGLTGGALALVARRMQKPQVAVQSLIRR